MKMRTLALAMWMPVAAACGSADPYTIVIAGAPSSILHEATSVELFIVPSCGSLGSTGDTPTNAILQRHRAITDRSPFSLGALPEGSYGFYARVRCDRCTVLAAGCSTHTLMRGGGGTLITSVSVVHNALGCDSPFVCVGGLCADPDAGTADAAACMADTCCTGGLSACGTDCVDLTSDPVNCGNCGSACGAGQACLEGRCVTPATTTWGSSLASVDCSSSNFGTRYCFSCPVGGTAGVVFGTDNYRIDSSVCTAAVHAGRITLATGGTITAELRPLTTYAGSNRNGIMSQNASSTLCGFRLF